MSVGASVGTAPRSPALEDGPPPYATIVFDCDSTLSSIEGIEELAGERRAEIRELTDLAMGGGLPLEAVFGRRLEAIRPARDAVEELGALYVQNLAPNAARLVAALRSLGKRVCILSGGLHQAVLHVALALDLAPDDVFAVAVEHDAQGNYADFDRDSPLCRAGGKLELLRSIGAEPGGLALIGDGSTDLEGAPACRRFVAYGGVVRRPAVFAAAPTGSTARDFAALLPLLASSEEIARLERDPEHAPLVSASSEHRAHLHWRTPPMLWIPGPTHVRPELLAECARPPIGHRTKAMRELIARLDPGLRLAFGLEPDSKAHVAAHTTSATGLMEGALRGAGRRILCVNGGAFATRWVKIARLLDKQVVELPLEWGRAVDPQELARMLEEQGPFDAVTLVSNETSTGVRTRLDAIGRVLAAHPETLLLVDLVSYIAGAAIDFDANGLDFGFAGVQKALALPPGISVLCASERYMQRARGEEQRGFYLDPIGIIEGHAQRKTPSTPCIPLYYALARQLEDISSGATLPPDERQLEGSQAWQARFRLHERQQAETLAWAERHGLSSLPPLAEASPTISCIRSGEIDVPAFIAALEERGHTIGNGYGDLKGVTFRIGHMGDHTEADLQQLLQAADAALGAGVS